MAEKLAILRKIGGGMKGVDLLNPDVTRVIVATTSAQTISVTQKPRYIIMATWQATGSNYAGRVGVVDVDNSTGKRMGRLNTASQQWDVWTTWSDSFTTISSTQVRFLPTAFSSTATTTCILIYY